MGNYFFEILTMLFATVLVRLLPIWVNRQNVVQENILLKTVLKNFPVAILTSLVLASILIHDSRISISIENVNLYAAIVTLPLIYFSKNIALIMSLGLFIHFLMKRLLVYYV